MSKTDVGETLREMWDTRPARPRDDRQVAGVAAGIARRYDIDPVLVRVGFVVAAFSGIGAALYIAGWVLLPDEPADPAAPRAEPAAHLAHRRARHRRRDHHGHGVRGQRPGRCLLPLLVVAGLLLPAAPQPRRPRTRGRRQRPTVAAAAAAAGAVAGEGRQRSGRAVPSRRGSARLGPAGRRAVRLGPARARPRARRRRRRAGCPVTPVTLGVALLAGGLTALMLLAGALT